MQRTERIENIQREKTKSWKLCDLFAHVIERAWWRSQTRNTIKSFKVTFKRLFLFLSVLPMNFFCFLGLLFTGDRHQQTNSSLSSTFTLLIYHRVYTQISICFWDQNAMSIKWTCSHRFVNVTEHDHRPQIFWFFFLVFHRVLKNEIESDKHEMTSNPL